MVSFFNDVDVGGADAWTPAVCWAGTKGFFASYDARPTEPLTAPVAEVWSALARGLKRGDVDANRFAQRAVAAEARQGPPVEAREFAGMIGAASSRGRAPVSRGEACRMIFD
jgi:hypothetical protein